MPRVRLGERARIGFANRIELDALVLGDKANIGHLNSISGPIWVVLATLAAIGNQNKVIRAKRGITWGRSMLKLGVWSKITSGHIVDCCRSVVLGDYTTIAGFGTQIWTHGYLHAPAGLERFRIDGRIKMGNNVYVGSASVINAGVRIGDAITIGSGTCVSGSLHAPGLYVSQPLRLIPLDFEQAKSRHPRVLVDGVVEYVVNKHLPEGR